MRVVIAAGVALIGIVFPAFAEPAPPPSPVDIVVKFTHEEANAAIVLFDIAVKAGGLATAQNALVLTRKIEAASRSAPAVHAASAKSNPPQK